MKKNQTEEDCPKNQNLQKGEEGGTSADNASEAPILTSTVRLVSQVEQGELLPTTKDWVNLTQQRLQHTQTEESLQLGQEQRQSERPPAAPMARGSPEGSEVERERDEGGTVRGEPGPARQTASPEKKNQEGEGERPAKLYHLNPGHQGQRGDKDWTFSTDVVMGTEVDPPPMREISVAAHTSSTEVIWKTQLNPISTTHGKIYKVIMASIGLDCPTPSHETRIGEDNNFSPRTQLVTTPIRNSATSLITFGKHVLTPRQGRIWELRNKSPLGGHGNQFGGSLP